MKQKWLIAGAGAIVFFLFRKRIMAEFYFSQWKNTEQHEKPDDNITGFRELKPDVKWLELLDKIRKLGYNVWKNKLVTQEEYEAERTISIEPTPMPTVSYRSDFILE